MPTGLHYGPYPDREAVGAWGPGGDTGVKFIESTAGFTFNELHWAIYRPFAILISARLGSLAPGASIGVAACGSAAAFDDKQVRFRATRSGGAGSTVTLGFDARQEFQSGYILGNAPTQPWLGPDEPYSWACHSWEFFDSRVSQGKITAKAACEAAGTSGLNNYSGSGHLAHSSMNGTSFVVNPSAPTDLLVTHVAVWWRRGNGTPVPSVAQFEAYMGEHTCPQSEAYFFAGVGFVGDV